MVLGSFMITLKELISDEFYKEAPIDYHINLAKLLTKLNEFREAYGKPLRVTSGYRSMKHHLEIYAKKGITDQSKIPMKSNHLFGLAADLVPIEDDIRHLHDWVWDNIKLMEELNLYFEALSYTPTWLHVQCVAPKSGNRFFIP